MAFEIGDFKLTEDERAILDGRDGKVLAKALNARGLDADELADVDGPGHMVISGATVGWGAELDLLEELAAAGLRAKMPLTNDPGPSFEYDLLGATKAHRGAFTRR